MSETSINPPTSSTFGFMNQYSASKSKVNTVRVTAVAERLSAYFEAEAASSTSQVPKSMEYFNLLLSLARGIDYSIANNEIPPRAEELPKVLNKVRLQKNDACSQGIVMVLMISVKNACRVGWFHEKETQELIAYADEIGRCFCDPRDISVGTNESLSAISTILSRFYPQIKMGQVLASLEVESGYEAVAVDFLISKATTHLPEEKIMLFVARMDSLETSACIITPQQVNFLLNGKGIERRTNVFVDPGPQMPTNVTSLLKYGTNLLQAVGQFNGRYVVSIAFMSMSSQPEPTLLKDYVQPVVSTLDSDSDLIMGQSRISLHCPISRTRIQVPVKGYSCKHPQCFDYSNFLDINSRRPSWRCPHCNNYICFTDLRIDQNIAKVLKEVGDNVRDVLISADGSWKAIMESDNDDSDLLQPQVLENQTSVGSPHPILDLTEENDDVMDIMFAENEDIKPLQQLSTADKQMNNANQEEEFWSGVMEYVARNNFTSPMFKDTNMTAVSNQDGLAVHADSGSMQNEGRNSGRTTGQPLPANFPSPGLVQRLKTVNSRPVLDSSSAAAAVPSVPLSTEVLHEARVDLETQRFPSPRISSSTVQPALSQHSSTILGRTSQALPAGRPSPSQRTHTFENPNSPKQTPGRFTSFQNAHLQQAFNKIRTPLQTQRPGLGLTTGTGGPPGMRIQHPIPQTTPGQAPRIGTLVPPGFQTISKTAPTEQSGLMGSPRGGDGDSDKSWRPPIGRMRGSLTGRALPNDISHLVIQPSRGPDRSGGPPPSNLSAPPHLQKSVPTNRNHLPSTSSGSGNTQNPL